MRRLRVLTLIDVAAAQGGAERFAIGLASNLPRDRFEPSICSTREMEPATASALDVLGISHVNLGRKAKWDVHRIGGLARLLRRERIDILHAHKFGSNLWGALIGRACQVPVVLAHEHTWSYQNDPLRVWLDGRVIGRLVTRFIAVSEADRERMVEIEHVPREKTVVIPANVYIPSLGSGDGDLRSELGLTPDTPVIAVVAVLRPQKALSVLLEAYALVLDRAPTAHLVIAGDGPSQLELEQLATDLALDGRLHFLGRRDDVDSILRAADVAALSSDFEGTPLFVTECMASRTPLVATAVGGVPDLIKHGRSGLLVPPRDPAALADGLARLLADPAERERLASEAALRLSEFTIDTITARVCELYETLADEAGL
ncbi:MAG: glycosyltransferase family 4 protein [Actinomycetota bacterium]|nr:glycosyltransferase family 4 protein [Actinomycetota bacterium]